jgi:hypothetical protein
MNIRRAVIIALLISAVISGALIAPIAHDKYLAHLADEALNAPPSPANDNEQQAIVRAFLLSAERDPFFVKEGLHPYFDVMTPRGVCLESERVNCDRFEMFTLDVTTGLVDASDPSIPLILQLQLEKQLASRARNSVPLGATIQSVDLSKDDQFTCVPGQLCRCKSNVNPDTVFLRLSRAVMSPARDQALALAGRIYCDGSAGYYKLLFARQSGTWRVSQQAYVGGGP